LQHEVPDAQDTRDHEQEVDEVFGDFEDDTDDPGTDQ
jgi:hypothetical protein